MQATKTKDGEIAKSRAQLRGPEPKYTKLSRALAEFFSPKPSFHTAYFLPSSACLKCLTSGSRRSQRTLTGVQSPPSGRLEKLRVELYNKCLSPVQFIASVARSIASAGLSCATGRRCGSLPCALFVAAKAAKV